MTAQIINGKELSQKKREEMKIEVETLRKQGITPGLAVIIVGTDPASQTYVRGKQRACEEIGIQSLLIEMKESTTEAQLIAKIDELNKEDSIDGILVQLPLPSQINEQAIIEKISPNKDVDGFHPINIGRMMTGQDCFLPCTPHGIIEMVKSKQIDIEGKHVVVVGRSNIVGKPVGQLFLNEHATVTYCHSRTNDLKAYTSQADILIAAAGKQHLIQGEYVKRGATVIDVGIHRLENGKLTGDVNFDEVKEKAAYITPVPGGVGPMTITMLLHNTIQSAKRFRA
ncbi:bifunctional methylenetetrahydrofolate dehydrogenase/methenyltetrahydrofolate cyclohydrolase FolD [Pueribacillus sp. YX66]|uniref:bifunctional methylenetetrahydrofolate dehydrogenase/methenyltetrahydrofolate cyclohydrolase FolD n=1 Tax=Pueribacillus sp. YX66 TaxID=3229242 RepID=UPI00358D95D9